MILVKLPPAEMLISMVERDWDLGVGSNGYVTTLNWHFRAALKRKFVKLINYC